MPQVESHSQQGYWENHLLAAEQHGHRPEKQWLLSPARWSVETWWETKAIVFLNSQGKFQNEWKLTHNNCMETKQLLGDADESFGESERAFRSTGKWKAASPNPSEEWECQISLTSCASFNGNSTFMHINTVKYKGLENRLNFQPLILTYCSLIPECTCQLLVSCRWYWKCKFKCSAVAQIAFQNQIWVLNLQNPGLAVNKN